MSAMAWSTIAWMSASSVVRSATALRPWSSGLPLPLARGVSLGFGLALGFADRDGFADADGFGEQDGFGLPLALGDSDGRALGFAEPVSSLRTWPSRPSVSDATLLSATLRVSRSWSS